MNLKFSKYVYNPVYQSKKNTLRKIVIKHVWDVNNKAALPKKT